ncbi:MAG: hypothetical protein Satyrvirus24_9 [Satyrvirus sp.]|uniref:Uncharacterized protein n=1 Tax=Satyrvirus sp. TaxID=2487771 RepID=A0A3G5AED6_9VIRU|nr:MAG: hypothetical protein Satyrvirus24_9 [Satyrvirus sp.]
MGRCKGYTIEGYRCLRNVLDGNYCHDHDIQYKKSQIKRCKEYTLDDNRSIRSLINGNYRHDHNNKINYYINYYINKK